MVDYKKKYEDLKAKEEEQLRHTVEQLVTDFGDFSRELTLTKRISQDTLTQAQKTNGRMTEAEREIKALKRKKQPSINLPQLTPTTWNILALAFLGAVIVIAAIMGVNLEGILPG